VHLGEMSPIIHIFSPWKWFWTENVLRECGPPHP
jgi:hypothetical protein